MNLVKPQVKLKAAVPALMSAVYIAVLGFNKEESEALIQDVRTHLESGELVYSIFADSLEIGFAIFAVYQDILYLSGVIIIPDFQGKGIVQQTVKQVQELYPDVKYIALRTQSLRMYVAATKVCSEYYPTLNSDVIPTSFAIRGQYIARLIHSTFPLHKNCYGGPLYGTKPLYNDGSMQRQWDSLCNFENGDAIIFIGKLR